MITAVLIDDKTANISILSQLISDYCPGLEVIGTANNIDDAYSLITKTRPLLVFLDIEMPGGSGFDLLKKFDQMFFEVIFITAYDQYAIKAFRENALDYLLKPIDIDALQTAVAKARQQVGLKQTQQNLARYLQQANTTGVRKISIPVQDGFLFINSDEIVRCEASGSYSWFFIADGKKIMVSMRLKECENLLSANHFFRVHNSHIINLNFASKYTKGRGGSMLMQDGSVVEVAASKKNDLLVLMQARL